LESLLCENAFNLSAGHTYGWESAS
jgi:hypothetical protein